MEDTKVPKVKEFKHLGSTVQKSGSCEREVKKSTGRMERMEKSIGSNLRQELPARVKGKVYSSVVRPAMVYELETLAVTKRTSGRDGSRRDEIVEVCCGSDEKIQD